MQTGEDILFTAPGPDPIPTATTEIVGTPGNALNVYWIVSHFPIGSVVSGPFPQKSSPNLLDDENYVLISWLPTPGASSYDLLFTKALELPRQPGRFLLARNLTQTSFRDQGEVLEDYDLAGVPLGAPQEEHIYFNNRDFEQPTLRFIPWPIQVSSIIFEDGSSQNTAGGGGLPAPPDRSIQFNDNSVFGGSQNLIWNPSLGLSGSLQVINPFSSPTPTIANLNSGGLQFNMPSSFFLTNLSTTGSWGITAGSEIAIDTGGSSPLLLNSGSSNGFVGIGTTNPQAKLEVFGNSNTPVLSVATNTYKLPSLTTDNSTLRVSGLVNALELGNGYWGTGISGWIQSIILPANTADDLWINPLGGSVILRGDVPLNPDTIAVRISGSLANGLTAPDLTYYNALLGIGLNPCMKFGLDTAFGSGWLQCIIYNAPNSLLLNPLGGNVGINTQNPQASIEVISTDIVTPPSLTFRTPAAMILGDKASNFELAITMSYPAFCFQARVYNGEGANISLNPLGGNLGIGIINPRYFLHGVAPQAYLVLDAVLQWRGGGVQFRSFDINQGEVNYDPYRGVCIEAASTNAIIFSTQATTGLGEVSGGSGTEQMRITAAGNVGIGTQNPQAMLNVAGLTLIGPTSFSGALFQVNGDLATSGIIYSYGHIAFPNNLPSSDPGVASKQLWYDPTDGNRVKFSP